MAFNPDMLYAEDGQIALSAEYNKVVDNVLDLNTRLNAEAGNVDALESLTTDTTTNGGHGNVRLSDRLGTGVGTGSNVTSGSASAQLADLRSRAGALETTVNATGTTAAGNAALSSRLGTGVTTSSTATQQFSNVNAAITTLNNRTTDPTSGNLALDGRVTDLETATGVGPAPYIALSQTTEQSLYQWTTVVFNLVVEATDIGFDSATGEAIIQTAGVYGINGGASFQVAGTSANARGVRFIKNGSVIVGSANFGPNSSSVHMAVDARSKFVRLVAGDRIGLQGWQNTASSAPGVLTHTADGGNRPTLEIVRLSS